MGESRAATIAPFGCSYFLTYRGAPGVYTQKLARPTAPCYNNEWLVRSISRGYPSTSLHQADPTYFNCPSATTNPTHRPIPFSTEAISSSLTLDRSGSYQARPNYPRAEGRKKPNVTGAWGRKIYRHRKRRSRFQRREAKAAHKC